MFRQEDKPIKVENLGYESPQVPRKQYSLVDTQGTFFTKKTHDCGSLVNQPVINVNVRIEQADDGLAECLSGCFSACLGIGKKAASGA